MKTATLLGALLLLAACADEPKQAENNATDKPAQESATTSDVTPGDSSSSTTASDAKAQAEDNAPSPAGTQQYTGPAKVQFDKLKHDFGTHTEGDSVFTYFNFQNIGGEDLKISQVKPSCTCTGVQYTKKAYKAGEKGKIRVSYPTKGKKGFNSKSVMVFTNAEAKPVELKFSLEVE